MGILYSYNMLRGGAHGNMNATRPSSAIWSPKWMEMEEITEYERARLVCSARIYIIIWCTHGHEEGPESERKGVRCVRNKPAILESCASHVYIYIYRIGSIFSSKILPPSTT